MENNEAAHDDVCRNPEVSLRLEQGRCPAVLVDTTRTRI
jgi:hypothetical protein